MNEENIPMDCTQFEEVVSDLNRPGTRKSAERKAALVHAATCSRCTGLLAEAEALDLQLRTLSTEAASMAAPAHVEERLRHEFRSAKSKAEWRRIRRHAAALATAAAIVLALGLWLYQRPQHGAAQAPATTAAVQGPAPAALGDAREPQKQLGASTPHPTANGAVKPAAASTNLAPESSSGSSADEAFIPLPYSDVSAALDDGAVVQVTMPREALASFGLPAAAMEGGGAVRADLLVSADGMPQAIRLLSQDDSGSSQSSHPADKFPGRHP